MSLGLLTAYSSSDDDDDSDDKNAEPSSNHLHVPEVFTRTHLTSSLESSQENSSGLEVVGLDRSTLPGEEPHISDLEVGPRRKFLNPRLNICPPPDQEPGLETLNLIHGLPEVLTESEPEIEQEYTETSDEVSHPYYDTDFLIPGRNQVIPGKYLLPPELPKPPPGEEGEEEEITAEPEENPFHKELLPGMSKREYERLKSTGWKDVTTTGSLDENPSKDVIFNTPLPFKTQEGLSSASVQTGSVEQQQYTEEEYYSYYMYQYYQFVEWYNQENGTTYDASNEDLYNHYNEWCMQHDIGNTGMPVSYSSNPSYSGFQTGTPEIKQKTFEELQEQDRQLEQFFNSAPNEYTMQRAAFKSTFRGTKTYRENNKDFNPAHFNQLTKGAKKVRKMFLQSGSVMPDKDRYIPEKDLPENREPKSNKQLKREAWKSKMKVMINKKS